MAIWTGKLFDMPWNFPFNIPFNINYTGTCVWHLVLFRPKRLFNGSSWVAGFQFRFFGKSFHPFWTTLSMHLAQIPLKSATKPPFPFFYTKLTSEKMHLAWLDFGIRLMRFLWQMIWQCIWQMECGWSLFGLSSTLLLFFRLLLGEIFAIEYIYWKWPFKGRMNNNLYEFCCVPVCVGSGES